MNAPTAAARNTNTGFRSPLVASTPPVTTIVSPGSSGSTASPATTAKISAYAQLDADSASVSWSNTVTGSP